MEFVALVACKSALTILMLGRRAFASQRVSVCLSACDSVRALWSRPKIVTRRLQNRSPEASQPQGAFDVHFCPLLGGSWGALGAPLAPLGALLAPSWPSKSILDGQRIGSNLDQNFEALQDRCWKPLRRILGRENGSMLAPKIDENAMSFARSDFFIKVWFFLSENQNFEGLGLKICT